MIKYHNTQQIKIGKLIEIERKKLKISREEISKELHLSIEDIHKIENGTRDVSLSELSKIAKKFGLSVAYFLNLQPLPKAQVLWRACSDEKKCRKVENLLKQYCQAFKHLNDILEREYKVFKPPKRSELEKFKRNNNFFNFTARIADEYRKRWNLGDYPAKSLIDAIRKNNILLFYYPLGDSGSAASIIGDFGAAILLNKNNVEWRLPFNIAHELYHLITWDFYDSSLASDTLNVASSNIEKHADAFAANLLMPEQTLKSEINKVLVNNRILLNDFIDIACKLGVSLDALTYRLSFLRMFTKEQMRAIRENEEIKKIFWNVIKKTQYSEKKITPLPEEYVKVVFHTYKLGKISKMKLAEYLNKRIGEVDNFLKKEYNLVFDKEISIGHSFA